MTGRSGPRTSLGPYEIKASLGQGGGGEVYRAWDPRLERDVALKILYERFEADPERVRRFIAEARAASALNHPNIVTVFDAAVDGGTPYIVSELIDGKPLRDEAACVNFYKSLLTGAGHKPDFVNYGAQIDKKIAAKRYDLILVHYADLPAVMAQLRAMPGRPDIVPILDKESKSAVVQAEKDYPFLIVPERMDPLDALDQIDHAMERRLKDSTAPLHSTGTN